mmetsp:Transcript_26471/g.55939  ORF Transcript_26471/g.55939 Transcript_26471/m.55939 type:complete len:705 (+) Transcript_26471:134-2248(+)
MTMDPSTSTPSHPPPHRRHFPNLQTSRAPHILVTETTEAQSATEEEIAPFYIELESLSEGQLDHLREVGLLPPLLPPSSYNGGGGGGGGGLGNNRGAARGKAAKLLGLDEEEEDGPKIELLDEDEIERASSPLHASNEDEDDGSGDGDRDGHDGNANGPFDPYAVRLLRTAHTNYLSNALSNPLPRGFVSLDASHPWMIYWCLHSLDLLGVFDFDDADGTNNGSNTNKTTNNARGLGGGGLGGLGGLGGAALRDLELMQKGQLLERIVSTLEHCWTDSKLEFTSEELASDARLMQLYEEQNPSKPFSSSAAAVAAAAITITGGGFGGGPQQMPHCATTYAAVLSLCIVASVGSTKDNGQHHPYRNAGKLAMELLTRRRLQLYAFFLTLREEQQSMMGLGGKERNNADGRTAFRMQHDGEIDVRASYCILAPCYLLGLLDNDSDNEKSNDGSSNNYTNPLLSPSISRHIASCQTFEGGFGAEPHNEAHGGYTFCALAALRILNSVSSIDVRALEGWLARRQMGYEGGFCGRTNKLVDGCYSFWQGGAVAVLDGWLYQEDNEDNNNSDNSSDEDKGQDGSREKNELSFDEIMLQRYILLCAQDVNGGLRDKPSKPKDFYHSCYNLSGLSVSQHALRSWPPSSKSNSIGDNDGSDNDDGVTTNSKEADNKKFNNLFGDASVNIVGRTDPVINIRVERVKFMTSQQWT